METGRRRRFAMAIPALCVAGCMGLQASGLRAPLIGAGRARLSETYWPVRATQALRRHAAGSAGPARVFNDMLFGGYLIYHAPNTRVFMDDRCELHEDWGLTQFAQLARRPDRLDGLAAYYGIDYAMIRPGSRIERRLADHADWELLYRDEAAALFARRGGNGTANADA